MESFINHIFAADLLSLREVTRLLLLSGLFTVAAMLAFPRNAPTRRALLLAAVTALTILPWLLAKFVGVWTVPLHEVPALTLATSIPNIMVWIWLVVAALLSGNYLVRVRHELSRVAQLPRVEDAALTEEVARLCGHMQMSMPKVRIGPSACSTTLAGDQLILPRDYKRWQPATLRSVLAHELVHIQRRDDRWLLLTRLLCLAYWWMPWLSFLHQGYVRAMEESCDDTASELIGQKVAYVDALVDAVGIREPSYRAATNMHAHHLVGRVGRFSQQRIVELNTSGVYWCVMGILAVVVFLTSVEPIDQHDIWRGVTQPSLVVSPSYYEMRTEDDGEAASQREAAPLLGPLYSVVQQGVDVPASTSPSERKRLLNPSYQPPVVYPGTAIRNQDEGEVVVEFSVARDGSVSQPLILVSQPPGLFDKAALRAVTTTRYGRGYTTGVLIHAMRTNRSQPPARVQRWFRFRLKRD